MTNHIVNTTIFQEDLSDMKEFNLVLVDEIKDGLSILNHYRSIVDNELLYEASLNIANKLITIE